jgi:enterobactin synthetase component D
MNFSEMNSAALGPAWLELAYPDLLNQHLGLPRYVGLACLPVIDMDPQSWTLPVLPSSLQNAIRRRQQEYLTGRYCACLALRQSGHPNDVYPARGADGLPIWPADWLGSISHSGDIAMAAAAPIRDCVALGIDIQQRIALSELAGLEPLIAQSGEYERLNWMDHASKILLVFSGKESLYKALYPDVRSFHDFDSAELVSANARILEFRLTRRWSATWFAGRCISVSYIFYDDYLLTSSCIGVLPIS